MSTSGEIIIRENERIKIKNRRFKFVVITTILVFLVLLILGIIVIVENNETKSCSLVSYANSTIVTYTSPVNYTTIYIFSSIYTFSHDLRGKTMTINSQCPVRCFPHKTIDCWTDRDGETPSPDSKTSEKGLTLIGCAVGLFLSSFVFLGVYALTFLY
jgi:hypothetical protein